MHVSGNTTPQASWFNAVNQCLEEIDPYTQNALPRSTPMGANYAYNLRPFELQDALERNTTGFLNYAYIGGRAGKLDGSDYGYNDLIGKGFTIWREAGTDVPGDARATGRWLFRARNEDANIGVLGPWFDTNYDAYMYGDISLTTEGNTNLIFGFASWTSGFPSFHFAGPQDGVYFAFSGSNILFAYARADNQTGFPRNTGHENSPNTLFRLGIEWNASTSEWSYYIDKENIRTVQGGLNNIPGSNTILRPVIGMLVHNNPIDAPLSWNIWGDVFAWQEA